MEKTFINNVSRSIAYKNYLTLMDLLSSNKLFNEDDSVFDKLDEIRHTKPFLSDEVYNAFDKFITEHIDPIICTYENIKEYQTPDIGYTNKEGAFEFHDESCMYLYFGRLMEHCIVLQDILLKTAMTELRPYFE